MLDPDSRYQNVNELENAIQKIKFQKNLEEEKTAKVESEKAKNIQRTMLTREENKAVIKILGWSIGKWLGFILCIAVWLYLGLSMTVTEKDGTPASMLEVYLDRGFVVFWGLTSELFWFNMAGIRYRLPFMKKGKLIHLLGSFIYSIVWFFIIVILLAIVQIIIL